MKSSEARVGIVPYITAWSAEETLPTRVIGDSRSGIAFADEMVIDRDDHDVLWSRMTSCPGAGRPEFKRVHSLRQRRAMRRLLCQICAKPADRSDLGVLWLLKDHREDWEDWPEGMANTYPPVCLACARLSVRLCPTLRRGHVAVRAHRFPYTGVYGLLHQPGYPDPIPVNAATVGYRDPAIAWTLAVQLVRSLHDCTIVDLD
ncbi:MAG TPA: hypothetical protein VH352_02450 [Pseudonocardiaceae bacterium]|jgi:hypothetical protein|nr:hypothetical protein [Pseudonocardiaceae bacterium]